MSSDHTTRTRQFHDALHDALGDLVPPEAAPGAPSRNASPASLTATASPDTLSPGREGWGLVERHTPANLPASGDSHPLLEALSTLLRRARGLAAGDLIAAGAIDALEAIAHRDSEAAALSEAAARFASPQRFREALYFVRCLDRDAAEALRLIDAHAYVSVAVVSAESLPSLLHAQTALLEDTTFGALWHDAGRLAEMLEAIARWREDYIHAYVEQHAGYNDAVGAIARLADELQWQATAIETLNSLNRLGPAVALAELVLFHEFEGHTACPADSAELEAGLANDPVCVHCGFRLGDVAPSEEATNVWVALDFALFTQLQRLQQRVLPRLIDQAARPGRSGNLDRFLVALQTNDREALARSLDDGLMAYLEDLLSTPGARVDLTTLLARDYPEITAANLEGAVAAFRRIVEAELARANGRLRLDTGDGA